MHSLDAVKFDPALLAACVLGLVLGAWIALGVRRLRESWRARAYNARGRRAEQAASKLLEKRGYRVVAQQERTTYTVRADDAPLELELILDFVVERDGERFAAEVKTGAAAGGLERADTRRQLLEYQLALGSRRVLLVDPEADRITEIAFPIPSAHVASSERKSRRLPLQLAITIALLVAGLAAWLAFRSH